MISRVSIQYEQAGKREASRHRGGDTLNKTISIFVIVLYMVIMPLSLQAADEKTKEHSASAQQSGGSATSETAKRDPEKEDKRAAIMAMKDKTLADLYRIKPEARKEIESAVGYAVFDATGVNVILLVGAKGKGVAVENANGSATYMQMARAGTGPGIGYKEYRLVLAFTNKTAFNQFKTVGMDAGASADATLKMGGNGRESAYAASFSPHVKVYQITDKGLMLQANWGGTKFLKDGELNE